MTTGLDGSVVVLVPRGHLHEGDECDALEKEIANGFDRGGRRMVVDLSQTLHLSARSLGILAHTHLEAQRRGGRLTLRNVHPEHRIALEVTGLAAVIEVVDSDRPEQAGVVRVA
jgi:anti-anti-sigma factor